MGQRNDIDLSSLSPFEQAPAREFDTLLSELCVNSRPVIQFLTAVAKDNASHVNAIAFVLEWRIYHSSSDKKLPLLYLLDSVVKNLRYVYSKRIAENIVETFTNAYEFSCLELRSSMKVLYYTWVGLFENSIIDAIWVRLQEMDKVGVKLGSVYVNPRVLRKPDGLQMLLKKDIVREKHEALKPKPKNTQKATAHSESGKKDISQTAKEDKQRTKVEESLGGRSLGEIEKETENLVKDIAEDLVKREQPADSKVQHLKTLVNYQLVAAKDPQTIEGLHALVGLIQQLEGAKEEAEKKEQSKQVAKAPRIEEPVTQEKTKDVRSTRKEDRTEDETTVQASQKNESKSTQEQSVGEAGVGQNRPQQLGDKNSGKVGQLGKLTQAQPVPLSQQSPVQLPMSKGPESHGPPHSEQQAKVMHHPLAQSQSQPPGQKMLQGQSGTGLGVPDQGIAGQGGAGQPMQTNQPPPMDMSSNIADQLATLPPEVLGALLSGGNVGAPPGQPQSFGPQPMDIQKPESQGMQSNGSSVPPKGSIALDSLDPASKEALTLLANSFGMTPEILLQLFDLAQQQQQQQQQPQQPSTRAPGQLQQPQALAQEPAPLPSQASVHPMTMRLDNSSETVPGSLQMAMGMNDPDMANMIRGMASGNQGQPFGIAPTSDGQNTSDPMVGPPWRNIPPPVTVNAPSYPVPFNPGGIPPWHNLPNMGMFPTAPAGPPVPGHPGPSTGGTVPGMPGGPHAPAGLGTSVPPGGLGGPAISSVPVENKKGKAEDGKPEKPNGKRKDGRKERSKASGNNKRNSKKSQKQRMKNRYGSGGGGGSRQSAAALDTEIQRDLDGWVAALREQRDEVPDEEDGEIVEEGAEQDLHMDQSRHTADPVK